MFNVNLVNTNPKKYDPFQPKIAIYNQKYNVYQNTIILLLTE